MAGIVDDADGLRIGMIADNELLHTITHQTAIPGRPVEELLQSATRRVREVRDRLNAFARQIGKLPFDIAGEMPARLGACEAVVKLAQEIGQLWPQRKDLVGGHP